ncbi:hypothetical protein FQR65_LT07676 [Abscondita terminalis]|nr:hypothetical protein FQR65_LT07676 [Abscondita terminalis]
MASGGKGLEDIFTKYAEGDKEEKTITLANAGTWFKSVNVIDGKTVTDEDVETCFSKLNSQQLNYKEFLDYIEELAKYKNIKASDIKCKLISCDASVHGDKVCYCLILNFIRAYSTVVLGLKTTSIDFMGIFIFSTTSEVSRPTFCWQDDFDFSSTTRNSWRRSEFMEEVHKATELKRLG